MADERGLFGLPRPEGLGRDEGDNTPERVVVRDGQLTSMSEQEIENSRPGQFIHVVQ